MANLKEYAFYKGEEILGIGTIKEIAEELNVLPSTIKYYGTNAYRNKLAEGRNLRT